MGSGDGALTRRGFLQVAGSALAMGHVDLHTLERAEGSASQFAVRIDGGAIVSLKRVGDARAAANRT